jgi:hypothetical protein
VRYAWSPRPAAVALDLAIQAAGCIAHPVPLAAGAAAPDPPEVWLDLDEGLVDEGGRGGAAGDAGIAAGEAGAEGYRGLLLPAEMTREARRELARRLRRRAAPSGVLPEANGLSDAPGPIEASGPSDTPGPGGAPGPGEIPGWGDVPGLAEPAGPAGAARPAGGAVIAGGRIVNQAELLALAVRLGDLVAPPARPGVRLVRLIRSIRPIRPIWATSGSLADPEERALFAWLLASGGAIVLEPSPEALAATAAWARPTLFHGDLEQVARLRARVPRRPRLPFGRLATLLPSGGAPLPAEEAAFWRGRGVRIVEFPAAGQPFRPAE